MKINGLGKFVGTIQPDGTIRIDDSRNPQFWLTIKLDIDEIEWLAETSVEVEGLEDVD